MRCFCTYFDRHYLARGLALYDSLARHVADFRLWALCMDQESCAALARLGRPGLYPIGLDDFEAGDADLLRAKANRTRIEYYFTCTPSLPLFIFRRFPEVDLVTYLDADLFFFADPEPAFAQMGDNDVAIVPHRFPPRLRDREAFGVYNVSWLSFRRRPGALACLDRWREQCLEWCRDRVEGGRFADQKYLDEWPARYEKVAVLSHKGVNLAPWNFESHALREEAGRLWVDGDPLIFFHFHGLKQIGRWVYDPNMRWYGVRPTRFLRRRVYAPYLREIGALTREASRVLDAASLRTSVRNEHLQEVFRRETAFLRRAGGVLAGKYILFLFGCAL